MCELRHGRKPQIFCNTFSEILRCLKCLFFSIVYFSTQRNTFFSFTRMVTNYLLFVVKIFVCALCCANLFFGFSISLISKTERISTLHCNKKKTFCQLLEETRVSLQKHFFLLLVHVFFSSNLSFFVVCSEVAATRTSAAGPPNHPGLVLKS